MVRPGGAVRDDSVRYFGDGHLLLLGLVRSTGKLQGSSPWRSGVFVLTFSATVNFAPPMFPQQRLESPQRMFTGCGLGLPL